MAGANDISLKRCSACNQDLPHGEFYYAKGKPHAACKVCFRDRAREYRSRPLSKETNCALCGQRFLQGDSRPGRKAYCSAHCRAVARARRPVPEGCQVEGCGQSATSRHSGRCKTHYRREWKTRKLAPIRAERAAQPCATCGKPIGRGRRHKYCSADCRNKGEVTRSIRRAVGRAYMAAKRSRVVEQFDPVDVLERDGWRCQLCGVRTPKRLRGLNQPTSPELDHIVPLARGGAHTPWNTQCLCRKCNRAKSDKAIGQLGLPLAA